MARLSPACFMPLPVATISEESRVLLKAARLWVMLARARRSARPPLEALLGASAARFCLLMELLVVSWQEPFTTYPPCADSISPDEFWLLTLLSHAEKGAELPFHACLVDMLPEAHRQRLWQCASALMADRIGAA